MQADGKQFGLVVGRIGVDQRLNGQDRTPEVARESRRLGLDLETDLPEQQSSLHARSVLELAHFVA